MKRVTLYFRDDFQGTDMDMGTGKKYRQIPSLKMACAMSGVRLDLVGGTGEGEGGVQEFRALVVR